MISKMDRLLCCRPLWAATLLLFVYGLGDKAEAVSLGAECGSLTPTFDAGLQHHSISLLDAWAGTSSFADGFLDQQHVHVKEHAWIERAEAVMYVLSAAYLAAKSCTDFYDNSWETWKFQYDLSHCDRRP